MGYIARDRQPGIAITSCTDWFKPASFEVESVENE
jgi:hypothetical protein